MGVMHHYPAAARAGKCRLAGKAGCDRRACTVAGDLSGLSARADEVIEQENLAAMRMSAFGTFETSTDVRYTAAFRGKPDISQRLGPLWSAASLHYS
jgi:hypothetical protein